MSPVPGGDHVLRVVRRQVDGDIHQCCGACRVVVGSGRVVGSARVVCRRRSAALGDGSASSVKRSAALGDGSAMFVDARSEVGPRVRDNADALRAVIANPHGAGYAKINIKRHAIRIIMMNKLNRRAL